MDLKRKYRDPRVAVVTGGAYKMRTGNSHGPARYRKKEKQGTGPRRRIGK